MLVKDLIEHLKQFDENAQVQFNKKVLKDRGGFTVAEYDYAPLEEKNVFKTRFGGNTVFIGEN